VYGWSLKSQILTSYSVDFGNVSRFYVSEQVGALFLVEMCEPDGSEASDTFSMGTIFSRVMKRGLYVSKCNMLLHYHRTQRINISSSDRAFLVLSNDAMSLVVKTNYSTLLWQ